MDGTCHFQALWGLELFGGSAVAELLNPASVVAQAELGLRNLSKAVAQCYELRKQSCAILEVAQAELRNPGCCASQVSQS